MTAVYPGGSNTYIPSYEASGKLMVDYARNPNKFSVLQWTGIVKTEKEVGRYLKMNKAEATRIASGDQEFGWADGSERPTNTYKDFEYKPFEAKRYNIGFVLGDLGVQQAEWDVLANYSRTSATRAMTLRSFNAAAALSGSSDIPTATATAAGGGKWDASDNSTKFYIAKGIQASIQAIHKATGGAVGADDLCMVISPTVAKAISTSPEIRKTVEQSPFAMNTLTKQAGEMTFTGRKWGVPDYLEGVKVIVEDAVKHTNKRGATDASSYIFGDNVYLVARPGSIETTEGSFCTVQQYAKEEMTAEQFYDAMNRRTLGAVVEHYVYVIGAPYSAYKLTAVIS